uniref:Uncharacterized protein n=1 Tax=Kalanchoe fedtschenkoi TaxID=63787 RepID=A0A7N0ZTR8_KALFE
MVIRSFGLLVLILAAAFVANFCYARNLNDASEGTAATYMPSSHFPGSQTFLGHRPNPTITDPAISKRRRRTPRFGFGRSPPPPPPHHIP